MRRFALPFYAFALLFSCRTGPFPTLPLPCGDRLRETLPPLCYTIRRRCNSTLIQAMPFPYRSAHCHCKSTRFCALPLQIYSVLSYAIATLLGSELCYCNSTRIQAMPLLCNSYRGYALTLLGSEVRICATLLHCWALLIKALPNYVDLSTTVAPHYLYAHHHSCCFALLHKSAQPYAFAVLCRTVTGPFVAVATCAFRCFTTPSLSAGFVDRVLVAAHAAISPLSDAAPFAVV